MGKIIIEGREDEYMTGITGKKEPVTVKLEEIASRSRTSAAYDIANMVLVGTGTYGVAGIAEHLLKKESVQPLEVVASAGAYLLGLYMLRRAESPSCTTDAKKHYRRNVFEI